jgi:hypothetical protein
MHNLRSIRRRFPDAYPMIVSMLILIFLALLVVGIGVLFVR